LGWKRGQDYKIEHGGFIKTSPAKLWNRGTEL
jgi:hypothetical protein